MGEGSGGGGGERERKRVAAEVGAVDPDSVGAGVVAAARGLDRGGVLPWSCGASACARGDVDLGPPIDGLFPRAAARGRSLRRFGRGQTMAESTAIQPQTMADSTAIQPQTLADSTAIQP